MRSIQIKSTLYVVAITIITSTCLAEEKLIFAIDLMRHGDRTPIIEIPKSPYKWNEGLGALTTVGMKQELQLGKKLRKKYIDQYNLLPKNYSSEIIYVRSTDKKRTIASARSLLSGLYPLQEQSISIQVVPQIVDDLLVPRPSKNIIAVQVLERVMWQQKTINLQAKLRNWCKLTGLKLNDFEQLNLLADNLHIRQLHHVSLPKGISNNDANEIISLGRWATINNYKLPVVTNRMGTEFLKTTNNYLQKVVNQTTSLKYVLLSGHDSSIMSVMNTLGIPLDEVPKYASHLNFSLYENNKKYYVKVTYNDSLLTIPGCKQHSCDLSTFNTLTT